MKALFHTVKNAAVVVSLLPVRRGSEAPVELDFSHSCPSPDGLQGESGQRHVPHLSDGQRPVRANCDSGQPGPRQEAQH